ncbi:MAG: hypothetical protein N3D71_03160, partial [Burkholderiaceae bacterium]|nr:hypothetical protein [Burkholderiaceae bacterium]
MRKFLVNSYLFGGNAPYVEELYEPAAVRTAQLADGGFERAKALVRWKRHIARAWPSVSVMA